MYAEVTIIPIRLKAGEIYFTYEATFNETINTDSSDLMSGTTLASSSNQTIGIKIGLTDFNKLR